MFRCLEAAMALIAIACMTYLLLGQREKDAFFPARKLGGWLFPKLGYDQRQNRLSVIAGVILFVIAVAAITFLVIKSTSRTH